MPFETVVIKEEGGHYRVFQGSRLLLSMPRHLFATYEADVVFPPEWRLVKNGHPVRRLFWNPDSKEFLMAGLDAHPARTVEGSGSTAYRTFLHGFWIPAPPLLLLRPYWNPPDPYDPFDEAARRTSLQIQRCFLDLLTNLRPPQGWSAILNVTDAYLDTLGVSVQGAVGELEPVREISLAPADSRSAGAESAARALETLATQHVGAAFPVLRQGLLVGVHTLCLAAAHAVEAVLDQLGIAYLHGPYRPH